MVSKVNNLKKGTVIEEKEDSSFMQDTNGEFDKDEKIAQEHGMKHRCRFSKAHFVHERERVITDRQITHVSRFLKS